MELRAVAGSHLCCADPSPPRQALCLRNRTFSCTRSFLMCPRDGRRLARPRWHILGDCLRTSPMSLPRHGLNRSSFELPVCTANAKFWKSFTTFRYHYLTFYGSPLPLSYQNIHHNIPLPYLALRVALPYVTLPCMYFTCPLPLLSNGW